jgi:hypothetical protein
MLDSTVDEKCCKGEGGKRMGFEQRTGCRERTRGFLRCYDARYKVLLERERKM